LNVHRYRNHTASSVLIGIADHGSLGIGTLLFPIAGTNGSGLADLSVDFLIPVWIVPKVSVPLIDDAWAFGARATVGTVLGAGDELGALNLVQTFGSHGNNVSVGGALVHPSEDGPKHTLLLTVSGTLRLSDHWSLLTENLGSVWNWEGGVLSAASRYRTGVIGFDAGLIMAARWDYSARVVGAFPWLALHVSF
jgi:hypothetical protein